MKFTYNWLKDFIEVKIPAEDLAPRLTMAGLEVTSLEPKNSDWVFEIEITPNRPDLLSVLGIAREVGSITGRKLKKVTQIKPRAAKALRPKLKITVESRADCPLYTAKVMRNVKVGPSPLWLQQRLESVGLRAVNNIVDITNFVQLSFGQPLHAFDLDKIEQNTIIVRRAKKEEKILTIDQSNLTLDKEILVIADAKKAIAVAGVIGGKETEVGNATGNILLESAKFDSLLIRHSRQRLGVTSESSYRFERNIDASCVDPVSDYALGLIKKIAGGEFICVSREGKLKQKNKALTLHIPHLAKVLGVNLKENEIKKILKSLNFNLRQARSKNIKVEIPSFRQDINQQVDLIEEVARIYGYDKIPLTLPVLRLGVEPFNRRHLVGLIRQILIGQGISETINYSIISRDIFNRLGLDTQGALSLVNPLSREYELLRTRLLPGLMISLGSNASQQEAVSVFEIANIYSDKEERLFLGLALCGEKEFYTSSGRAKDRLGLLHLKGVIEFLLKSLGIKDYDFSVRDNVCSERGQAFVLKINTEDAGYLARIKDQISHDFDIKNKTVYAAELCLDTILSSSELKKAFKPLPAYPSVRRDISLVLRSDCAIRELLDSIKENSPAILKEARIVDYYRGKQIPKGSKGLTISCLYLSQERTLTDEEVNRIQDQVRALLKQKFSAQIR